MQQASQVKGSGKPRLPELRPVPREEWLQVSRGPDL